VIAEYEKLPSAPDVEYDSLHSGQVRLVWMRPNLTGPSSQLSGYRIFCCNKNKIGSCIPSKCRVQHVSEKNGVVGVVISGLSMTKPTYFSVKIIRTFNGKKVTDDLYSDAVGYCAGRKPPIFA
jgi:hypothetical protein